MQANNSKPAGEIIEDRSQAEEEVNWYNLFNRKGYDHKVEQLYIGERYCEEAVSTPGTGNCCDHIALAVLAHAYGERTARLSQLTQH